MSIGYFTDKNSKPSDGDILHQIGSSGKNWDYLHRYLTAELNLKGNHVFYGVNYGWALRFSKSGRSVVALYPGNDCFTVQIILNKNQAEHALSLDLNSNIAKKIAETNAIYEGKWVYLTINQDSGIEDIIKLINVRIGIK